ncbi:Bromodomain transcription factor [Rhynchospora pubera]|uniref:Bromodomain transcription factor n=1 Tax=Rhynchospora pubera TaxID=906938 RepID=A0AAV8D3L4_9POAL|nr:Bromodomain transcription factor [Rhynchospora pubera]
MESPANPNFHGAIATVSVSQICGSVGYTSVQPSALRAFSDVAIRYLLSIGRLCAASAASHNRTHCNLFDLVLSLETLSSTRGFSGGSNPTRPLLESVVLKELMAYLRIVDGIPFAKLILKERERSCSLSSSMSFAQMGMEVPVAMAHVPRWLPCFPDSWEAQKEREKEKGEEKNTVAKEVVVDGSLEGDWMEEENKLELGFSFDPGLNLLQKRERQKVKFRIRLDSNSARGKRRKNCYLAVD